MLVSSNGQSKIINFMLVNLKPCLCVVAKFDTLRDDVIIDNHILADEYLIQNLVGYFLQ